MKVERRVMSGQMPRQAAISSSVFAAAAGRAMRRSDVGVGVLERDVEIGQDQALRHQRDQVAHMRIGIDVVQPHPGPEAAQIARQIGDVGAVPPVGRVLQVQRHRRRCPG